MPQLFVVGREVLLHHVIAIGAAEIEDIVRIFFKQIKIGVHRFGEIFTDDLGIFPAPFRIQVGITDHV